MSFYKLIIKLIEVCRSLDQKKIDKGFCLNHWNLSYRRKFIRTLWIGFFFNGVFFIAFLRLQSKSNLPLVFVTFGELLLIFQVVYNYYRWKQEK